MNSVNGMFGAKVKVDSLDAYQISIYVPHHCVHLCSPYTDMGLYQTVENGLHDWKGFDNIDKGGFAVFEEFGLCTRRESVFVPVTIAAMLAPAYT